MAHDKIASAIVRHTALALENDPHWLHGLDYGFLDARMESPEQLDVWLEHKETGEKIRYHVAIEKAAIQPRAEDTIQHEEIDSEYGSDRYTIIRGGKKLIGTITWEKRDGSVSIQKDELFSPEGKPYDEEKVILSIGMIWACYNANIGVIVEKDLCIGVGPSQIRLTDEVWMDLLAKAKEHEPED